MTARHRHIWPINWLCQALEVSRSGFHAWLNRPTSPHEIHDAKLVAAIERSFKASDRTYGARRVWRDVLEDGLACGLHRIERLMRINALRARPSPAAISRQNRHRCSRCQTGGRPGEDNLRRVDRSDFRLPVVIRTSKIEGVATTG